LLNLRVFQHERSAATSGEAATYSDRVETAMCMTAPSIDYINKMLLKINNFKAFLYPLLVE